MPKPSKRGLSAPMGHLGDSTETRHVTATGFRSNLMPGRSSRESSVAKESRGEYFYPESASAVQEAALGESAASDGALAWMGPVRALRQGPAEAAVSARHCCRQCIGHPPLPVAPVIHWTRARPADSHLWPCHGRRSDSHGRHR